ncbi:MAG TPA: YggS family pyridoxal phosphate enzyme [Solirubrobacteraceae bacterium]
MVELIRGLSADRVKRNLERVRAQIADAGRDPDEVEILAAVKYVPAEELAALAEAGIAVVGENRAQELAAKQSVAADRFTWDFIGNLQSRKVRDIVPRVRYIHSVATDSVLAQLGRHGGEQIEVLVEVNVAGEAGKSGVSPQELPAFLERCPATVVGLMTMPPFVEQADHNRRHFAALRELAERHGLAQLSMGTSQDYLAAVQEGATIVRLGTTLYGGAP